MLLTNQRINVHNTICFMFQAFTVNGYPTIITKDKNYQDTIGQRKGLSFSDIAITNKMYNCGGK